MTKWVKAYNKRARTAWQVQKNDITLSVKRHLTPGKGNTPLHWLVFDSTQPSMIINVWTTHILKNTKYITGWITEQSAKWLHNKYTVYLSYCWTGEMGEGYDLCAEIWSLCSWANEWPHGLGTSTTTAEHWPLHNQNHHHGSCLKHSDVFIQVTRKHTSRLNK